MATKLVAQPLDDILARYGSALEGLGKGKATRVMGRALNYEGQRAFVQVKRALRKQTSIPTAMINRGTKTVKASTKAGGALQFAIVGTGRPLPLKVFGPRQFGAGTKATVWGRRQLFPGAFMGPRPGEIAPRLGGQVFHRDGKSRLPIEMLYGPGIANELVKDESAQSFYEALPRILDRVGKEIATVLRGF
ncbi:hypothetical protein [Mesorhizobium sp. M2A.F.Ca.ET.039.01.1.1]|uniref:hypothetical protein n=1 Tax=Mesorhizobium sp. M2A.F.Ca.ET.039.01.1.1 TaxID=2496746 RepID=UPI000FCADA28|nr:hypothetical protein [Mesorhizobium sp. M2A.F.Ca.ET.039.01.1.1]RWX72565.1 hypothetical protein EOA24_00815 [Mesorhizobium sp. M2A.F.Ca.ET.039.01.1.1]